MSEQIEAIRARWTGVAWHYGQNSLSPTYYGDAWIYVPAIDQAESEVLLDLDEPNGTEVAFLQLAAAAPTDIAALLDRVELLLDDLWRTSEELTAARALMQALLAQPGVVRTPDLDRLMDAYNASVRGAP